MMDIIGNLPPEVTEEIFKFLKGKELWSCLSVNRSWRNASNINRLWVSHCKRFGIASCDISKDDSMAKCEFSLCALALEWKRCYKRISNWKSNKLECLKLPCLNRPRFFSRNNNLVIIDDNQIVTSLNLQDGNCTSKFFLPHGVVFPDEGNILITDDLLIVICHNVGLIYKNDIGYSLRLVFANTKEQNFLKATSDFPKFLITNEDSSVTCDFSFLSHGKFWASYRINDLLKHHVLLDVTNYEVSLFEPPLDTEVVEVIGTNHNILFESEYEVLVYETCGKVVFKKHVGEFCCAAVNDNVVAVFKSSYILIYDLLSGFQLHQLYNECYKPQLFISPSKDIIFLLRKESDNETVFAFNANSGQEMWTFKISDTSLHAIEKTFVDVYGTLLVLCIEDVVRHSNNGSRTIILDIESGYLFYEESHENLHFICQNCFVKDLNPIQLFLA